MEVLLQTYYTLLPIIATALVGWVGILLKSQKKKDTDREEKQKALSEGIMMILRYMLQRYHGEYMIQKKISYSQYQNWKDIFGVYRTLGGNSIAIEWDHEIDELDKYESDVSPYEEMLKKRSENHE
jgi:hypothetical protein